MKPLINERMKSSSLHIVEKYNTFINYIYPMLINMSGQHRVLRDYTINKIISQIGLFNDAAKSNQISRLYLADAGLSSIRDLLRILSEPKVKLLSHRQYGHATGILSEVGAMTNAWISKLKNHKVKGNDG